jgi:hypothetical protein
MKYQCLKRWTKKWQNQINELILTHEEFQIEAYGRNLERFLKMVGHNEDEEKNID